MRFKTLFFSLVLIGPAFGQPGVFSPQLSAAGEVAELSMPARSADDYYIIETVPIPDDIVLEVGGMDFAEDGTLFIATHGRGEIWTLRDGDWERFAHGLHEPLGLVVTGPGEVVVGQRPEFTRISDTTGDGVADLYETITDAWNYSGHMYEYTFGPVRDDEGNLWGALGYWFIAGERFLDDTYADGDIDILLRRPIRPPFPDPEPVYRGWVFKVTPEGEFVPWAPGARSSNGLGLSPDGELFLAENQGEYVGANPILHVTRNDFLGYPIGLLWDETFEGDPTAVPLEQLDAMRKPEALIAPYGEMGQSTAQLLWDETGGGFGPFEGQIFVADHTRSSVMRATLEKIRGEYQGAMYPFLTGFQSGNNRLAFSPGGDLYVGQTARGWRAEGDRPFGLQRVVWTGEVPMEIHEMTLTAEGFDLVFTHPVDPETAENPENYYIEHYHYRYDRQYGSPKIDRTEVTVEEAVISEDGKRVSLVLSGLVAGKIYEVRVDRIRGEDGSTPLNPVAYYTLQRLLDGSESSGESARTQPVSPQQDAAAGGSDAARGSLPREQQIWFEQGELIYRANCASCHGMDGGGVEGVAPSLARSEWLPAGDGAVVRILLQGKEGETVLMPPFGWMDDEEIAAVSTYLRHEWHGAAPVSPSRVSEIREATAARTRIWTDEELEAWAE